MRQNITKLLQTEILIDFQPTNFIGMGRVLLSITIAVIIVDYLSSQMSKTI